VLRDCRADIKKIRNAFFFLFFAQGGETSQACESKDDSRIAKSCPKVEAISLNFEVWMHSIDLLDFSLFHRNVAAANLFFLPLSLQCTLLI
jgi:hypothetical protein